MFDLSNVIQQGLNEEKCKPKSKIKPKRLEVKSNNVKNEKILRLELCHLIKKAQPQGPMLKTHI
jgi:hypothetical protein